MDWYDADNRDHAGFNDIARLYKAGVKMIFTEIWLILCDIVRFFRFSKKSHEGRLKENMIMRKSSILHGFGNISKLYVATLTVVMATVCDIDINMRTGWVISLLRNIFALIFLIFGLIFVYLVQGWIVIILLPDVKHPVAQLMGKTADITAVVYLTFGYYIMMKFIMFRRHMLRFMQKHCSLIQIDRYHQDRLSKRVFTIVCLLSCLTETMLFYMSVCEFAASLNYFKLQTPFMQVIIQGFIGLYVWPLAVPMMALIYSAPVLSVYLSCCLAERIERAIDDILRRRPTSTAKLSSYKHKDVTFVEMTNLSTQVQDVLTAKYAHCDWPLLSDIDQKLESSQSEFKQGEFKRRETISSVHNRRLHNHQSTHIVPLYVMQYRRLIRLLSETRDTVNCFEGIVGNLHALGIGLNTIGLSQFMITCMLRYRLDAGYLETRHKAAHHRTGFVMSVGTIVCGLVMVLINIILFKYLDRLPNQLNRLKSELFSTNQNMLPEFASLAVSKVSAGELGERCDDHDAKRDMNLLVYNANLIGNAWDLYDETVRLSMRANLRFLGDMYYNKRLLLTIFGQQVSFCLLYVQFVYVYSLMRD